jgi:hypothetical protein
MIMRARLSYGFLAAGFVLSLAAAGCGDDDTGGGTGGTGGSSTAGKGGSGAAGKGGAGGGASGKGGAGGSSAPTVAECVTKTNTANGMAFTAECTTCACTQDAKTMVSCDTNCWKLISCAASKCPGAKDTSCALAMCSAEISAAGATAANASPVGMILQGTMCGAKCAPGDSGVADAGN